MLRVEVKELRSTAARVIEQASRLVERCAELEDLNLAEHQSQPNHDASHTARRSGLRMVRTERTMISALDRIGREQLSPNKPVICLQHFRISPA
jgi:hypothetical protein